MWYQWLPATMDWTFLSNRTHQTRVGLSLSKVAKLTSGIVQGNDIGPLLFLIFINDLMDWEHLKKFGVSLRLFADDVKLYTRNWHVVAAYAQLYSLPWTHSV